MLSQEMMATLQAVVDDLKRTLGKKRVTLLDIPCGDMAWMHRFLQTRDDIMYTGMDIVPELIQHHEKTYPASDYRQRRFIHGDIVTIKELTSNHIVLCRMMMQHLPSYNVLQVLQKISNSGSHVVLMTSIDTTINKELDLKKKGRFHSLNLELPPYKLEPPICLQRDLPPNTKGPRHFIGLWKLPLHTLAQCPRVYQNRGKDNKLILHSCTRWKVMSMMDVW